MIRWGIYFTQVTLEPPLLEPPLQVAPNHALAYKILRQPESSKLPHMIKPIQDALAGLIYRNDRQITDAQTRKTNIDGRFRLRRLSAVYARAFGGGQEFVYTE
jgi:hypothetical protein